MYHFFAAPEQIGENEIRIVGTDVNHIKNVLRMRPGEQICVSSSRDGLEYRCEIREISSEEVTADIMWAEDGAAELSSQIYLFQGLPKGDKMELIIQKAVELGVHEIIPVASRRCVVKLDAKKEAAKLKRGSAISESAAKQSKRLLIPRIREVMSFKEAVACAEDMDIRLFPYELAKGMEHTRELISSIGPGKKIAVFIGPEGGFAGEEAEYAREHGLEPITLGKRILRTETAGLAVLSVLMYQLEE